jgi:DNA (cytosine-5)-methyltransferase 1
VTLTYGSLFSGIGGIDLGLDRSGMVCTFQVEIDDYATRVLAKHWPNVPRHRDVRGVGAHNLPAVDVIAGGFPCQGISDAGRREGLADPRSGLWREFARIIRELRPRYVLVENVAALLYRGLSSVLGDLAALGYDAEWHCIPAAAVGAPHIRDRVYIMAYTDCPRDGGAQHEICPGRHAAIGSRANGRAGDVADATSRGWSKDVERLASPRCEAGTPLALRRERTTDVPDASGKRGGELAARQVEGYGTKKTDPYGRGQDVADAHCASRAQWACIFSNARSQLAAFERSCSTGIGVWAFEPDVGRVADGVPARVDRLRGLGNAVVPQVAEFVGRLIVAHAQAVYGEAGG